MLKKIETASQDEDSQSQPKKLFQCPECQTTCSTSGALRKHKSRKHRKQINIPNEADPCICYRCNIKFHYIRQLIMQAIESSGEGCISTTDTAKDIKSNILDGEITNSKNAAICPICNKSYANKHSLSSRKYLKHSKKQTSDPKVDSYEDFEKFKANHRSDILNGRFHSYF